MYILVAYTRHDPVRVNDGAYKTVQLVIRTT